MCAYSELYSLHSFNSVSYVGGVLTQNVIAMVCDCDETLTADTTHYLLKQNDIDIEKFWKRHDEMVLEGWDPTIVCMTNTLSLIKSGKIRQNTNTDLTKLGETINPNNGIMEFIPAMTSLVKNEAAFKKLDISIEFYIISSGFEAIIRGIPFAKYFKDIFGGTYAEDPNTKKIDAIKSSISFTEKTKFLYAINKGISGKDLRQKPFLVNKKIPFSERRIPFEHMLYIGDSHNDVPCFSAVRSNGGQCVGIAAKSEFRDGHQLSNEQRTTMGPYRGNYEKGSDLYSAVEACIKSIGYRIVNEADSV